MLHVEYFILYTCFPMQSMKQWKRGWVETQCLCVDELERGTKIASATLGPIISETTLVQLGWDEMNVNI